MTINYFGSDLYAILSIILSILAYLNFYNFGVPTTVGSLFSSSGEHEFRLKLILKGTILLVAISAILIVLLSFLYLNTDLLVIYFNDELLAETFFLIAIITAINLPLNIFISSFVFYNKIYIERVYFIVSSSLPILSILIADYLELSFNEYLIIRFVLLFLIGIISFIHFLVLFKTYIQKDIFRQFNFFKFYAYKQIIKQSLKYIVIGASALVIWNTDALIMKNFMTLEEITFFLVIFKLFTFSFFIFSAINLIVTPMISDCHAKGDYVNLQYIYNNSLLLSIFIGGSIWIGGLLFSRSIIHFWVGDSIDSDLSTIVFLGAYTAMMSINSLLTTFLIQTNSVKKYGVLVPWIEAVVHTLLVILFLNINQSGFSVAMGIAFGMLSSFIMTPLLLQYKLRGKIIISLSQIIKKVFFMQVPFVLGYISLFTFGYGESTLLNVLYFTFYILYFYTMLESNQKILLKKYLLRK